MVTLTSVTSGDPQITIDGTADHGDRHHHRRRQRHGVDRQANDAHGQRGADHNGQFTVSLTQASSTDTVVSYTVGGQHGHRRRATTRRSAAP